jgi:hypothetical protein
MLATCYEKIFASQEIKYGKEIHEFGLTFQYNGRTICSYFSILLVLYSSLCVFSTSHGEIHGENRV